LPSLPPSVPPAASPATKPRSVAAPETDAPLPPISRGELFAACLKIGLLGFGGVLPWARQVFVDERRWLTDRGFAELIGMCQVLPGPNVVNLAVIIGARSQGPVGSLLALTGVLFVPVLVVLLLATFYAGVAREKWAHEAIGAASAAGAGLILGTAVRLLRQTRPPLRGLVLGGTAFVTVGVLRWPLLWVLPALVVLAIALEWRATR
jgi:chromate transporter